MSAVGAQARTAGATLRKQLTKDGRAALGQRACRARLFPAVASALVVGGVVAAIAYAVLLWITPATKNEAARIDVVKVALTVVAGVGGVVALVIAYRRQRDLEQGRFVERFGAAAAQLGATDVAIRIAGVYAMSGVADESDGLRRQQCINVLCGYLRLPYTPELGVNHQTKRVRKRRGRGGSGENEDHFEYRQNDREVRQTIVRAIADHLRPTAENSWSTSDFDFRTAHLEDADFGDATFSGATRFEDATFTGTTIFVNATFSGAAGFSGARFTGAAGFTDATFIGAAMFRGVTFAGGASFRRDGFGTRSSRSTARSSGGRRRQRSTGTRTPPKNQTTSNRKTGRQSWPRPHPRMDAENRSFSTPGQLAGRPWSAPVVSCRRNVLKTPAVQQVPNAVSHSVAWRVVEQLPGRRDSGAADRIEGVTVEHERRRRPCGAVALPQVPAAHRHPRGARPGPGSAVLMSGSHSGLPAKLLGGGVYAGVTGGNCTELLKSVECGPQTRFTCFA
ncbi:pentapeptide repeat-containing protein [Nocardia wallacei]|uniref:pentapeptide repeat-containing protein n=1 Tax=Nocardia wallacei TaxID=480035 RepID=UPI002456EA0F|nr:pentapeptide repeat-containing protein [Nocardia wallacei]